MKKILFSCLAPILAVTTAFALPQRFYSLKAKLPTSLTNLKESLPVYYKGHKIDLAQGWNKLPECSEPCTFSLLITEDVDFTAKGNTVRFLKRKADQEYLWYDLTLNFFDEIKHENQEQSTSAAPAKKTYSWEIEQRESADTPDRIPEHTIVLLTNPAFIASLQTETALPGAIDIVLPTIIFKDDVDPTAFKESSLNILMGPVLDLDAIHRKDNPSCMTRKDTVVISAAKQNYETH
jgi:hypothetical protein